MNFKIGELIKWFETYAYGDLVKDAGIGIIIEIKEQADIYETYKIFRVKKKDMVTLSNYDIEKINKEKK
jgi:hypothetical protein